MEKKEPRCWDFGISDIIFVELLPIPMEELGQTIYYSCAYTSSKYTKLLPELGANGLRGNLSRLLRRASKRN